MKSVHLSAALAATMRSMAARSGHHTGSTSTTAGLWPRSVASSDDDFRVRGRRGVRENAQHSLILMQLFSYIVQEHASLGTEGTRRSRLDPPNRTHSARNCAEH